MLRFILAIRQKVFLYYMWGFLKKINVDKITKAFTTNFCKWCKHSLHLWTHTRAQKVRYTTKELVVVAKLKIIDKDKRRSQYYSQWIRKQDRNFTGVQSPWFQRGQNPMLHVWLFEGLSSRWHSAELAPWSSWQTTRRIWMPSPQVVEHCDTQYNTHIHKLVSYFTLRKYWRIISSWAIPTLIVNRCVCLSVCPEFFKCFFSGSSCRNKTIF